MDIKKIVGAMLICILICGMNGCFEKEISTEERYGDLSEDEITLFEYSLGEVGLSKQNILNVSFDSEYTDNNSTSLIGVMNIKIDNSFEKLNSKEKFDDISTVYKVFNNINAIVTVDNGDELTYVLKRSVVHLTTNDEINFITDEHRYKIDKNGKAFIDNKEFDYNNKVKLSYVNIKEYMISEGLLIKKWCTPPLSDQEKQYIKEWMDKRLIHYKEMVRNYNYTWDRDSYLKMVYNDTITEYDITKEEAIYIYKNYESTNSSIFLSVNDVHTNIGTKEIIITIENNTNKDIKYIELNIFEKVKDNIVSSDWTCDNAIIKAGSKQKIKTYFDFVNSKSNLEIEIANISTN